MKTQNYQNHRQYYPPHHFIFLPLVFGLTVVGIYKACTSNSRTFEWILFSILAFCFLYITLMLRQHYALGNQNRIVRLEFRLRYFEMFGVSSKAVEEKLSFAQIAALRFAGDDEFKILLERALAENLSGNEIKKAIQNWQADLMRV